MPNPYISGTGFYLPSRIVTNNELSSYMSTTDEWIQDMLHNSSKTICHEMRQC